MKADPALTPSDYDWLRKIGAADVQSLRDERGLRIDAVGIKGLRWPITIRSAGWSQATVATLAMTVNLAAAERGTHMSRFLELLETQQDGAWGAARLRSATFAMLGLLGAESGSIEMRFPFFVAKRAPVSGAQSLLDYEACWRACVDEGGRYRLWTIVAVPATSLCPCSKEISDYGAHNQRSIITLAVESAGGLALEELARDVALELQHHPRVGRFTVEAENFESIHNHSAYARIADAS